MWVFDDPRICSDKEPFALGADATIEVLVADIPNAQMGFRPLFSATPCGKSANKREHVAEVVLQVADSNQGAHVITNPIMPLGVIRCNAQRSWGNAKPR